MGTTVFQGGSMTTNLVSVRGEAQGHLSAVAAAARSVSPALQHVVEGDLASALAAHTAHHPTWKERLGYHTHTPSHLAL